MELPEHSCDSCIYFNIDASKPISLSDRRKIAGKNWDSKYFGFDYYHVSCSRNKLNEFDISIDNKEDIHEQIISTNKCKKWSQFKEGISANDADNRRLNIKSIKLIICSIIIAIIVLAISIIALIHSLNN